MAKILSQQRISHFKTKNKKAVLRIGSSLDGKPKKDFVYYNIMKGNCQMNNYLMLNGKQINLTEEQVLAINQSFSMGGIQLSSIAVGDTFKIGEYEFILLELLN